MTEQKRLRHCPFCGGSVQADHNYDLGILFFLCAKCGAVVSFRMAIPDDDKSRRLWNMRFRV